MLEKAHHRSQECFESDRQLDDTIHLATYHYDVRSPVEKFCLCLWKIGFL